MRRNNTPILKSDRLLLRPLTPDDAAALHETFHDQQTMQYMPTPPHQTISETAAYLKNELANSETAAWAICLKEKKQPFGIVNYLAGTAVPGMGYILNRYYWGKGYAVEACKAALAYGFEQLGFDRVELWIDQRNQQSHRVASKLGFLQTGQIAQKYPHRDNHHIMLTYGLRADEYYGKATVKVAPLVFRSELVLLVQDVMETAVFYREKLGFRISFLYGDPPQHGGVTFGDWTGQGVSIQLSQIPPEQPLTPGSYLYIYTDTHIELLYEMYLHNDVTIIHPLQSHPWGMREFTAADNNGYRLRFGTQG